MHLHSSLSALCTLLTGGAIGALIGYACGYLRGRADARTGRSQ